jgi:hypothetical protein
MYNSDNLTDLLQEALRRSWCQDSLRRRDRPHWDPANPSIDQCYISSLVVNAIIGFDMYECPMVDASGKVIEDTHAFNVLPDGRIYDTTAEQFKVLPLRPIYDMRTKLNPHDLMQTMRQRFELLEPTTRAALDELISGQA